MTNNTPTPSTLPAGRSARPIRRALFFLVCFATIIGVFYTVENWRGKRAWLNYKKELEAKGERLDIQAFIPPPIPDEQNMLKVPIMERWTYRAHETNSTAIRIPQSGVLYSDWPNAKPTELREWAEYFYSSLPTNASAAHLEPNERLSKEEILPLIAIEDAPVADALRTLARQAGLKVTFHTNVINTASDRLISFRWENVTARQALYALLENYDLKLVPDLLGPGTDTNRVIIVNTNSWAERFFSSAIASTNSLSQDINSAEVLPLITMEDASRADVIRILARQAGINFQFAPTLLIPGSDLWTSTTLRRENVTARQFLNDALKQFDLTAVPSRWGVYRIMRRVNTAADIVKAFEKFEPEFRELYAACAKPKARFDFDYEHLFSKPDQFPNFINVRNLAQSLTLRASAELALNRPEAALLDIKTCLRLSDCLTNQSTLVSGMIRVALNGLIIGPIWEGLASKRWNEKQLSELQHILSGIDLLKSTAQATRGERAYENHYLTSTSQREISKALESSNIQKDLERRAMRFAIGYLPRGWIYANLRLINQLWQENMIECLDLERSVVSPQKVNAGQKKTDAAYEKIRPGNFLGALIFPGFSKAVKVTAQNQTYVNEAIIACALERYRLVHGSFPGQVEALAPQFLTTLPHDVINGQPLKYRRTDDGQYVLYSVAWDEKDDAGRPAPQSYNGNETGDWAWRFPEAVGTMTQ